MFLTIAKSKNQKPKPKNNNHKKNSHLNSSAPRNAAPGRAVQKFAICSGLCVQPPVPSSSKQKPTHFHLGGLLQNDFMERALYGKEGEVHSLGRSRHRLPQPGRWSRLAVMGMLIGRDENSTSPLWFSSPHTESQSHHEKSIRQTPVEGHSTEDPTNTPQDQQSGKSETLTV